MTEVQTNFKNKYEEYNCAACEKKDKFDEENQEHIYYCNEIKQNKGLFCNIFENTYETKIIKEITKQFTLNMKERKKVISE